MNIFNFSMPTTINFGSGTFDELGRMATKFGKHCLIIGPELNDSIQYIYDDAHKYLENVGIKYYTFYNVEPNPSTATIKKCLEYVNEKHIEFVIAVGGGSTIDAGKMIASLYKMKNVNFDILFETYSSPFEQYPEYAENRVPLIAVSTTSGTGSQCTQASVITDEMTKQKLSIYHQKNFPDLAIVDPHLMLSLPPSLTAATAFDAFTHLFESYLNDRLPDFLRRINLDAMNAIVNYLPKVLDSNELVFREKLALADIIAGINLSNGGAHLPHPMSEVINSFLPKLNHGQSLSVVYPGFVKYIQEVESEKCKEIKDKISSKKQSGETLDMVVQKFIDSINIKLNLKDYGLTNDLSNTIVDYHLWKYLPFAPEAITKKILRETLQGENL